METFLLYFLDAHTIAPSSSDALVVAPDDPQFPIRTRYLTGGPRDADHKLATA